MDIARCVKVAELIDVLRRYDGDLPIRFRDGDVAHPGVYVMREDRTDHVDVGSPIPGGGLWRDTAGGGMLQYTPET